MISSLAELMPVCLRPILREIEYPVPPSLPRHVRDSAARQKPAAAYLSSCHNGTHSSPPGEVAAAPEAMAGAAAAAAAAAVTAVETLAL